MADLHPIVIPAMEYTYKSVKFTCSGEGLYKDGYLYDPHAEKLIPTKTVKAGAEPKELHKKPLAWWKAQCAFRGLNQSGAIADLQLRLREAKKKILLELKSAETKLNNEFKEKNKVARNDSWSSLKNAEQKAKANPQKYLTEAFPKGATGRPANLDIVVLKIGVDEREAISSAAESLGLESASVDAPWTSSKKPSPDRWLIVGRTRDAVWNQMREIEREAGRSRQEFAKEKSISQALKKANSKTDVPKLSAPKVKATPNPTLKPTSEGKQAKKTSISTKEALTERSPLRIGSAPTPDGFQKKQAAKKSVLFETDDNAELPGIAWTSAPGSKKAVPRARSPLQLGSNPKLGRTKQTARKNAFPERVQQPGHIKAEPSYVKNESKATDKSWATNGVYQINCPEIERQWAPQGGHDSLTLDLYLQTVNGKQQLYGIFDFRVISGVMRFQKTFPASKKTESSKKRKHENIDEDEGDIDMGSIPEYAEGRSSDGEATYNKNVFYLGANDKPSARKPTWRYRWRGRETGEGEIQLYSDREVQSITFSESGDKLSGTIKCDFIGEGSFTGYKVGTLPHPGHVNPETEWKLYNEEAHEYARRARWGGGGWRA